MGKLELKNKYFIQPWITRDRHVKAPQLLLFYYRQYYYIVHRVDVFLPRRTGAVTALTVTNFPDHDTMKSTRRVLFFLLFFIFFFF